MFNSYMKRDKIVFAIICYVIFIAIITVAPMSGEDYGLTKMFHGEGILERLNYALSRSFLQINSWNARLGEQVAIFELSMPRRVSVPLYSCTLAIFSCLIGLLPGVFSKDKWAGQSFLAAVMMFLLWPGMEVFFWKTANSGYLQTMFLTAIAVIPYSRRFLLESLFKRKALFIVYLLFCFLAGISFENVPFAVLVSILTLCFWERRKHISNYFPLLSLFGGWLLLITSKSTSIRREYYTKTIPHNGNAAMHYIDRFNDVVVTFFSTSSFLLILSICAIFYLSKSRLFNKYHLCLIICSVLIVGSMMASPYTEPRSFLFAWFVMYSFICYALNIALAKQKYEKIQIALFITSFCYGIYTLTIYCSYGEKLKLREQGIVNAIGSKKCQEGYEIGIINDNHGYRYLNNRDEWYFYNMIGKSYYYGCMITNEKKGP